MIEANFACFLGIKGHIRVEKAAFNREAQLFDGGKQGLQIGFQVKRIVVITSHNCRRANDIALSVQQWQNIRLFRFLPPLIGN